MGLGLCGTRPRSITKRPPGACDEPPVVSPQIRIRGCRQCVGLAGQLYDTLVLALIEADLCKPMPERGILRRDTQGSFYADTGTGQITRELLVFGTTNEHLDSPVGLWRHRYRLCRRPVRGHLCVGTG